jgi:ABC-type dipeptide/oligopeptide/nickel transport system permease component
VRDRLLRQRWWLTRIALLPLHLAAFTLVTFVLLRLVPGDPITSVLGPNYTQEAYDSMQKSLGLDGSVWQQLGAYFGGLFQLQLGTSIQSGANVATEVFELLPGTIELAVQGLIATIIVSVILGHLAVFHPRTRLAKAVTGYARAAGALPEFVLAVGSLFLFYTVLHWAPAPLGRLSTDLPQEVTITGFPFLDTIIQAYWPGTLSMAAHLLIPILVLTAAQSAVVIRILVSSLQTALEDPATLFRLSTGASRRTVMLSVYRRAAPPVVTMLGQMFGYLVGGAIVLETLFGFPGVGQYAVKAVQTNDYPAMQGFLLVIAGITLVVYLLVDLVTMVIDPRRRPGGPGEAA